MSKATKNLSPRHWKILARGLYGRAAEARGVKMHERHFKRVENAFRDHACVLKFGPRKSGASTMGWFAEAQWWHYADALSDSITKDFILFKILGDKDLAPSKFKMFRGLAE